MSDLFNESANDHIGIKTIKSVYCYLPVLSERSYCGARRHAVCVSAEPLISVSTARRISLGGEDKALYPALSSCYGNQSKQQLTKQSVSKSPDAHLGLGRYNGSVQSVGWQ